MKSKDALIVALLAENNRLRTECTTDPLTGIGNRRKFTAIYNHCWQAGLRYKESLSLIVIDIDHFKNVNSVIGHVEADKVLCMIAAVMRSNLRKSDELFRHGGEEFVAILPRTELEEALIAAERLRSQVEATRYTISLGIATCVPRSPNDQPKLLKTAYFNMNKAKELGRNQVYHESMFLEGLIERSQLSENKPKLLEI